MPARWLPSALQEGGDQRLDPLLPRRDARQHHLPPLLGEVNPAHATVGRRLEALHQPRLHQALDHLTGPGGRHLH